MANTVTIEDAKARLEDLILGATRGTEWLIVDHDGQPVAVIAAPPADAANHPPETAHASLIGMMKGQIELSPDFDEPLEDFKPYME